MAYSKGGRGKQAPYQSTHIRVPEPLKDVLQAICDRYRETLDIEQALACDTTVSDKPVNLLTRSDAVELATKILGQKKSAKVSLSKLLSAIYGQEIVL